MGRCKTICVAVVVRNDEILVVKDKKQDENCWRFPTGVLKNGEEYDECCISAVADKTGQWCMFREVLKERTNEDKTKKIIYCLCESLEEKYDEGEYSYEWVNIKEAFNRDNIDIDRSLKKSIERCMVDIEEER